MSRLAGFAKRAWRNLLRGVQRIVARAVMPRGRFWLRVRLAGPVDDLQAPPFLAGGQTFAYLELLQVLASAAEDPRVAGVFVQLAGSPLGLAKVGALRRALAGVREAGKPVVAYGESLGAADLLLASAGDRTWMPPAGSLHLVGLRLEGLFLKDLLDNLGVDPEVVRVGDFKSAGEMFTRQGMSDAQREQLEALGDDLYSVLVGGLAEGRGLDEERVRALIDAGPYSAREAEGEGLIDGCCYPDEVEDRLRDLAPTSRGDTLAVVDAPRYARFVSGDDGWSPLHRDLPRIAYVVAAGAIHRGQGLRGIGSEGYRTMLDDIARDPAVQGVVLRVESPGGDGLASDLLWRSVKQLAAEKPVVVSMGEVAASGGYYLAAGADAIVAEAATVTGSIGVVGGKLNVADLYARLGIARDAVERGARAGLLSEARGFSSDERAAVQRGMRSIYELFLERVAEGRGLTRSAVRAVAGGRIWSGTRAAANGLVDALGGPLEALGEVRRRAGLRGDERVQIEVHPRTPRLPALASLLGRILRIG